METQLCIFIPPRIQTRSKDKPRLFYIIIFLNHSQYYIFGQKTWEKVWLFSNKRKKSFALFNEFGKYSELTSMSYIGENQGRGL